MTNMKKMGSDSNLEIQGEEVTIGINTTKSKTKENI